VQIDEFLSTGKLAAIDELKGEAPAVALPAGASMAHAFL
jgi:hypothetical protein